ncbi:hypothetical protein [Mycobacterium tuberculosis]|uniref:hypothetical protein n=1 Tax=Mycobacterium tuberculosis TaxID=1773 RepID=UPI00272AB946|nr:hypothetical protein [Mycobacterium tuberculosis]
MLFVRLRDGLTLDSALVQRIRQQIRDNTTPRLVESLAIGQDWPPQQPDDVRVRAVRAAARRPDPRQRAGPAHPAADPRQHHATPRGSSSSSSLSGWQDDPGLLWRSSKVRANHQGTTVGLL